MVNPLQTNRLERTFKRQLVVTIVPIIRHNLLQVLHKIVPHQLELLDHYLLFFSLGHHHLLFRFFVFGRRLFWRRLSLALAMNYDLNTFLRLLLLIISRLQPELIHLRDAFLFCQLDWLNIILLLLAFLLALRVHPIIDMLFIASNL